MKTIGIVCEGPRDFDLFSRLIDHITGEENRYQSIQPEGDATSRSGTGWKGVWKWCETNAPMTRGYFTEITPQLDLLVIHMDADVSRKETEVHCECSPTICSRQGKAHPLYCDATCPISLPCPNHKTTTAEVKYLQDFIVNKLKFAPEDLPVCIVIPADSTDAWIVAAYDAREDSEAIENPWDQVIAKAPQYHGIRLRNRPQKSKGPYDQFIDHVCEHWETVTRLCQQASCFDASLRAVLTRGI